MHQHRDAADIQRLLRIWNCFESESLKQKHIGTQVAVTQRPLPTGKDFLI